MFFILNFTCLRLKPETYNNNCLINFKKNQFKTAVWLNHPFTNTTWKTSFAHHQAKEQEESYSLISQRCKQVNTRQDVQNFLKNLDQPNAISLSTTQALKPKTYTSPALGLVVDGQSVLSNVSVLNSIFSVYLKSKISLLFYHQKSLNLILVSFIDRLE